jgi:hypothetical protein
VRKKWRVTEEEDWKMKGEHQRELCISKSKATLRLEAQMVWQGSTVRLMATVRLMGFVRARKATEKAYCNGGL